MQQLDKQCCCLLYEVSVTLFVLMEIFSTFGQKLKKINNGRVKFCLVAFIWPNFCSSCSVMFDLYLTLTQLSNIEMATISFAQLSKVAKHKLL